MAQSSGRGESVRRRGTVQIPIFYKILVYMIFVAMLPVILLGIISIGGTESIVAIIGTFPSVLLLTLITVLVVLMWSSYLARQVTRPIVELSAIASRISRGDLPDKELEVISSDEIGELIRAFNRMINTYRILDNMAKEEPD